MRPNGFAAIHAKSAVTPCHHAFDDSNGTDQGIRCRFVSEWYKVDTLVSGKEGLLSEIDKNKPDVIVMDLNLYAKIDGIETTQKIRSQFDIPVLYTV